MTAPAPAVPWRWGVVWLFFAATLLNYTDRLALANTQRFLLPEFAATPAAQKAAYADLNTAFGLAFALGQVAAGFLVDRFSLRWLYVAAILAWSAAGAATGLVAAGSLGLLVACRVALGLGESFNWPCAVAGIQRTVPRESRGLANGIFHGGASVGALCTPFLVVALVDTATGAGWRTVFIAVGALGGVWAAAWLLVTRGERAAVIDTPLTVPGDPGPSLGAVLAGPLFWICLVSTCGVNVCWHLYNQWLPRHLAADLGVSAGRDQYLLAGFYLAADLGGMAAGWATRALARSGVRVGRARQLVMTALAAVTAAGSAAAVALPANGVALKMAAFCAVAAAAVGGYAVVFALIQDTAPRHTALVVGLCGCGSWLLISGLNQVVKADPGAGVPGWLFPAAGCAPVAAAAAGWCWPVRRTDGAGDGRG